MTAFEQLLNKSAENNHLYSFSNKQAIEALELDNNDCPDDLWNEFKLTWLGTNLFRFDDGNYFWRKLD